ncbi:hypothetical protein PybrP1_008678 [[Pythium] brassicae (nom. inval.)]|nr:hypothetical protein PybrP1_008678 [[Pythium] brassicae (nom. inval.)]
MRLSLLSAALGLAATTLGLASAHTWIDCLDTDHSVVFENSAAWVFGGEKGNGLCKGYVRGYAGRGDVDINTKNTYKIQRSRLSEPGIPLCQFSSAEGYNSTWRKPLSAVAGDVVYFAYLPNGHVAKDVWARKTEYAVYSTGFPGLELNFTTDFNETRRVNGSRHTYDDLKCGETFDRNGAPSHRAGDHIPCIGEFTIPQDTAPGRHQFVWAWKFYTKGTDYAGPDNFVDYLYTSCFDVDVRVRSVSVSPATVTPLVAAR